MSAETGTVLEECAQMIFVNGLHNSVRRFVLSAEPDSLETAVQKATTEFENLSLMESGRPTMAQLSAQLCMLQEQRDENDDNPCWTCGVMNEHLARNCPRKNECFAQASQPW